MLQAQTQQQPKILPVFCIITRTSGRPIFFEECQDSIDSQDYLSYLNKNRKKDNERLYKIVTFDNDKDYEDGYLMNFYEKNEEKMNIALQEVTAEHRNTPEHFPYNKYLNSCLTYIQQLVEKDYKEDGLWIIILDDDDKFICHDALSVIASNIVDHKYNHDNLYIWKCQIGDYFVPSNTFGKYPKQTDIKSNCFCFHSSKIKNITFGDTKKAIFITFTKLFDMSVPVWIDRIFTSTNYKDAECGNGRRNDKSPVQVQTSSEQRRVEDPTPIPTQTTVQSPKLKMKEITFPKRPGRKSNAQKLIEKQQEELRRKIQDEVYEEICEDDEEVSSPSSSSSSSDGLAIQLLSLLRSGKKVYILDEYNMKRLSKCVLETTMCEDICNKLISVMESTSFEKRFLQLNERIERIVNVLSGFDLMKLRVLECERKTKELSSPQSPMAQLSMNTDSGDTIEQQNDLDEKLHRLVNSLNQFKSIENEVSEVARITSPIQRSQMPSSSLSSSSSSLSSSSSSSLSSSSLSSDEIDAKNFIQKIYVIIDTYNNPNYKKNNTFLSKIPFEVDVVITKTMELYHYQIQVKEIILAAKRQNLKRIMILDGTSHLSCKFVPIFQRMIQKLLNGDINDEIENDTPLQFDAENFKVLFLGDTKLSSASEILSHKFVLSDYMMMFDDIVQAKLVTHERAHLHWSKNGCKEGRYGRVCLANPTEGTHVNNRYGYIITESLYDVIVDEIERTHPQYCDDVMLKIQEKNLVPREEIYVCKPDIIIPKFRTQNPEKNRKYSSDRNWYYAHFSD